jgi:hypothetical protein
MKYFLHDSSSFQDEKITELFIAHGYEGLGLFYTILEKLAYQEKPVKTAVLKKQLSVGKKLEKCWAFLEQIELISSNNGETFNNNLLKFSEKYQIRREKNKERVAQWRENQSVENNVTHYESVRDSPKEKISKVNRKEGRKVDKGSPSIQPISASLEDDSKPKEPHKFPPDEATCFTIVGFSAFVTKMGFGNIDKGIYLPDLQRRAEQTNQPRDEAGWENFILSCLKKEVTKNSLITVEHASDGNGRRENPTEPTRKHLTRER